MEPGPGRDGYEELAAPETRRVPTKKEPLPPKQILISPRMYMEDVQSCGNQTAPLPSHHMDHYERKVNACKVEVREEDVFQDTWGTEEDILGYRQEPEEEEVREKVVATTDGWTDEEELGVFEEASSATDNEPEVACGKSEENAPPASIHSFLGSFHNSLCFNY